MGWKGAFLCGGRGMAVDMFLWAYWDCVNGIAPVPSEGDHLTTCKEDISD